MTVRNYWTKFEAKISRIVESLETGPLVGPYLILSFFTLWSRCFLEMISNGTLIRIDRYMYFFIWFYLVVFSIVLLFHFFTKQPIGKIIRLVLASTVIVQIPPVLDLIFSGGEQFYLMSHLSGSDMLDFISKYFTFFGDVTRRGASPGIRVEITLISILSCLYCWIKTRSIIRSVALVFSLYSLIFIYVSETYIVEVMLRSLFGIYEHEEIHVLVTKLDGVILFFISLWILKIWHPQKFAIIIHDLRFLRLMHFLLMLIIGFLIGSKAIHTSPTIGGCLSLGLAAIGLTFAWLYSVMTNNLIDIPIDQISNSNRPLVTGEFNQSLYVRLLSAILFSSLLFSYLASVESLILMLIFIGNYYLYSMPPLRMKRILIFSKTNIALNSYLLILLGSFLAGVQNSFIIFSLKSGLLFIVGFMMAINFIDIKDYEGDRIAGIQTLPVMFGLRRSKVMIGIIFILNYLFVGSILLWRYESPIFGIMMIVFGPIQFLLMNRKNFQEKYIFLTYLASLLIFCFCIVFDSGAWLLLE